MQFSMNLLRRSENLLRVIQRGFLPSIQVSLAIKDLQWLV